ncbi:MAG: glutathione S-transferase N-terminal domain-containing protein [Rhodospirillaceae bacterium]|nr:glutathione S-transferase N-terminal domain-containing protein [Rhodospirillaceae bacterium]
MKMYYSPLSPFVRKVRVAAMELGLADRIELAEVAVSPIAANDGLAAVNPLVKIPALVADDGELLFDSAVIVEYLDTLAGGNRLVPATGPARWRVKRTETMADGLMDAAVLIRYESALRPAEKRWPEWIAGQQRKIDQALDAFEGQSWLFDDAIDAGKIALGCALGYLDFRFPETGWRKRCETLGRWYENFAKRPSMQATKPSA